MADNTPIKPTPGDIVRRSQANPPRAKERSRIHQAVLDTESRGTELLGANRCGECIQGDRRCIQAEGNGKYGWKCSDCLYKSKMCSLAPVRRRRATIACADDIVGMNGSESAQEDIEQGLDDRAIMNPSSNNDGATLPIAGLKRSLSPSAPDRPTPVRGRNVTIIDIGSDSSEDDKEGNSRAGNPLQYHLTKGGQQEDAIVCKAGGVASRAAAGQSKPSQGHKARLPYDRIANQGFQPIAPGPSTRPVTPFKIGPQMRSASDSFSETRPFRFDDFEMGSGASRDKRPFQPQHNQRVPLTPTGLQPPRQNLRAGEIEFDVSPLLLGQKPLRWPQPLPRPPTQVPHQARQNFNIPTTQPIVPALGTPNATQPTALPRESLEQCRAACEVMLNINKRTEELEATTLIHDQELGVASKTAVELAEIKTVVQRVQEQVEDLMRENEALVADNMALKNTMITLDGRLRRLEQAVQAGRNDEPGNASGGVKGKKGQKN